MTIKLIVKHDLDKIPLILTSINEGAVKRAVARSISRTFTGLQTGVTREIRGRGLVDTRKLSIDKIKSRFLREISSARPSQQLSEMYGRVDFTDRRPGLSAFHVKQIAASSLRTRRRVYSLQASIMGKTVNLGRAFLAYNKNVVLRRTAGAVASRTRGPLEKRFGPSFAYMVSRMGIAERLQAQAEDRYAKEIAANLDFYLSKL